VPVAIVVAGFGRRDHKAPMSSHPKIRTDVWLYVTSAKEVIVRLETQGDVCGV
jgi:hypothetical protein